MYYLLVYDVVSDYVERRGEFRQAHAEYAKVFLEREELLLGGAFAEPVDGALILFKGESPEVAENFAKHDPYVTNGLVTSWKVRIWTIVVGAGVEPLQPWTP